MSAQESGKSAPLTRRDFLQTSAGVAAAAMAAGALTPGVAKADGNDKPGAPDKTRPSIAYDEGTKAVREFYKANKEKLQMPAGEQPYLAHGLQLMTAPGNKIFMEVLYADKEPEGLPKEFNFQFSKCEEVVHEVKTRREPIPTPHGARPGYGAKHNQSTTAGTNGWHICFNGVVVSLTAYHVLCNVYWNNTRKNIDNPPGDDVLLYANNVWNTWARVYDFPRVYFDGRHNKYELAMASFNTPANAEAIYRSCSPAGPKYPYPRRLFPGTNPVTNVGYHKTGAGASTCGVGTLLVGYGLRGVDYGGGRAAMFDGQLILTKMADAGDSGALIVRDDDELNPNNDTEGDSVLGLYYTGGNTDSVACPLFNIGWKQVADYAVPGTGNPPRLLPSFTGNVDQVILP